jgi:hypothetical protein
MIAAAAPTAATPSSQSAANQLKRAINFPGGA